MSEPTTEQLENTKKFPWQKAVIVLCGALSGLFGLYVLSRNKGDDTCRQQISALQKDKAKSDSMTFYWQGKYLDITTQLFIKNNIIDRQKQVIDNTDSLVRKKFEKPAKQIVKNNE